MKEKKPFIYKNLKPDQNVNDLNLTAIDCLICISDKIIVMGGQPFSSPNQITCFTGEEINNSVLYSLPDEILPMQVIMCPTVIDGALHDNLLILTQDASLLYHDFESSNPYYVTDLFGPLEVLCSRFYTTPNEGETLLQIIQDLAPEKFSSILTGGSLNETINDIFGLLITAHSSGIIRFWCVSNLRTYNLLNLSLLSQEHNPHFKPSNFIYEIVTEQKTCKISAIEISVAHKRLVSAFDLGKIGIWQINPHQLQLLAVHDLHPAPILDMKIKNMLVISGDFDGNLAIFDMETDTKVFDYDLKITRKSEPSKQSISVNGIEVYDNIAAISISNGLIHLFDFNTMQILPAVKSPKTDLKSDVPKRNEVGIIKMLYTQFPSSKVFITYEKSMHLMN